jgi:hypothetical protein
MVYTLWTYTKTRGKFMTDMTKFAEEMKEHWDTDVSRMAHTGTFPQLTRNGTDTGWVELTFTDEDGLEYYAEVNEKSEVWHWDLVPTKRKH